MYMFTSRNDIDIPKKNPFRIREIIANVVSAKLSETASKNGQHERLIDSGLKTMSIIA